MTQSTRRGYVFEQEVERGLQLAGLESWKIPDSKAMGRISPLKTPADFILSNGKKIMTIEAKQTKLASIPWSNFREHQVGWVLANPSVAYFVINFNNRRVGNNKVNETFLVDAHTLSGWMKVYSKSVPIDEFRRACKVLKRKTNKDNPLGTGAYIDFGGIFDGSDYN